jgi:hypothetical protein
VNTVRAAALGVAVMVAVMVAVLATGRSGPDRMAAHSVGQPAPPWSEPPSTATDRVKGIKGGK